MLLGLSLFFSLLLSSSLFFSPVLLKRALLFFPLMWLFFMFGRNYGCSSWAWEAPDWLYSWERRWGWFYSFSVISWLLWWPDCMNPNSLSSWWHNLPALSCLFLIGIKERKGEYHLLLWVLNHFKHYPRILKTWRRHLLVQPLSLSLSLSSLSIK